MAELDRFEAQLTGAVRRFADRAQTEVDAMAMATHAARGRRASGGWLARTVPVPVPLFAVILLILALVASLAVGAWRSFRSSDVLPGPSAAASATAAPSVPAPTADALGVVHVTGTETVVLQTAYSSTVRGEVTQLRGGVVRVATTANDPRASGTATFAFSIDVVGGMGVEWGTYRLENGGGVWEGPCSGSSWNDGDAALGGCWLTGSGAFAGFTYYRGYSWIPGSVWVEGIIYPGPPPEP